MTIETDKKRFICYELGLLSLSAALSTRDGSAPIYAIGVKLHQRKREKKAFRDVLDMLESHYAGGSHTEDEHCKLITHVSDSISSSLSDKLHNGRFRIGTCQKLINVHLKYLWTAGLLGQPLHCPVDGIIRDKARIDYDWTTSDSIEEYKSAIARLKTIAGDKPLAVWELEAFRRRGDER